MKCALVHRFAGFLFIAAMLALMGCATTRYERSPGEVVDDKTLNRRVTHALSGQPVYKFPDVHVQTYRGVVQLNGFVASEAQRQAAEEIARRVRGVNELHNSISVAPLAQDDVRDYIPGRAGTNEINRAAIGAPGSASGSGSATGNSSPRPEHDVEKTR